jgi:hypothetical protein
MISGEKAMPQFLVSGYIPNDKTPPMTMNFMGGVCFVSGTR